MRKFNLALDAWIPTDQGDRSLLDVLNPELGPILDINLDVVPRLAVLRLLIAIASYYGSCDRAFQGLSDASDRFDLYGGVFQCPGVPESAGRRARDIIEMVDDGNLALDPADRETTSDKLTAIALIVAYFCDRPGIKARMAGVGLSGNCPLHMGKITALRWGRSLRDSIDLNIVPVDAGFVPPWLGDLDFSRTIPTSPGDFLLWPWRRVRVIRPGIVGVCAGSPVSKNWTSDPLVVGRASPSRKPLDYEAFKDRGDGVYDMSAIDLNQASPRGAWKYRLHVINEKVEPFLQFQPVDFAGLDSFEMELSAPIGGWGDGTRLQNRYTTEIPPKSALVGLLAAALGRLRGEDLSDLNNLVFVLDEPSFGKKITDFQTVRDGITYGGDYDRAIITYREYLTDYSIRVQVYGNKTLLETIKRALRAPVFPLYLGRKSNVLCRPPLIEPVQDLAIAA